MKNEWYDSQKTSGNIEKLLQERVGKANPRRKLTFEEAKRLAKLEGIAEKLKRGENVQSSGKVTHYLHTNYNYCEVVNV